MTRDIIGQIGKAGVEELAIQFVIRARRVMNASFKYGIGEDGARYNQTMFNVSIY